MDVLREMKRRLKAVHVGQWLPIAGFVANSVFSMFFSAAGSGLLSFLGMLACWLFAPFAVFWNLIHALRTLAAGRPDPEVLRLAARHNLAMLPYFVISTVLWLAVIVVAPLAMMNPWLFWLLPVVIPLGFLGLFCTWLTMYSTSGYVIAQIVLLWRQKRLTLGQGAFYIILQLLPVTDVLGSMALSALFATPAPPGNQSQASPGQAPTV